MDEKEVTEMKEQIAAEEAAKEAEEAVEKAKEEEATQTPTPEVEPEKEKSGANPFLLALPLLLVFGGIGGYLYLKTKRKQNSSAGQDPDAGYLDDDDDLDIYELPEEPEVKKEPVSEDDPDYWLDEEDDQVREGVCGRLHRQGRQSLQADPENRQEKSWILSQRKRQQSSPLKGGRQSRRTAGRSIKKKVVVRLPVHNDAAFYTTGRMTNTVNCGMLFSEIYERKGKRHADHECFIELIRSLSVPSA